MPLLGDPGHRVLVESLKALPKSIEKPSAILVLSAHWEEAKPSITSGALPSLLYDYTGFPPEAYQIQYPCAGEPALAGAIHQALKLSGIDSTLDNQRDFDHGVFVPCKLMYPEADIPVVQLSLVDTLDPELHIKIGQALQQLDYENLLVIGSGSSFHDIRSFFAPDTEASKAKNLAFEDWLLETCGDTALDENVRRQRLIEWEQAPGARFCHPREEHLLPLHICYGLAGGPCSESFETEMMGKKLSMYLW